MSGVVLLVIRLIAAAILFTFVGWAFALLWRDIKQQSDAFEFRQFPSITLQCAQLDPGEPQLFHQSEIILGRDPTCDFAIDDELVSGHHARLSYHHAQWWAEDLQSKNGTHINQIPLEIPTVVISGDTLECGKTKVVIKIG
jgi:hypothetical protein